MGACIHAKTVAQGIEFGLQKQIGVKDEKRIFEIYERYKPWIDKYRGGMPALNVAAGINHESRGDPLSTSSARIQECGLWSVLGPNAEAEDLDPFDPEANILMGARLRNKRVKKLVGDPRYEWLATINPYEYTKLLWTLPGSLGMGGWREVMGWMFYGKTPKAGSFKRAHPYEYMVRWVRRNVDKLQAQADSGYKIGKMGLPCVACRIVRTSTVDWLSDNNSLSTPGTTRVAKIPDGLPEYSPTMYAKIWATPKKERHDLFPQYLRVPETKTHSVRDDLPYHI
jgi:hypothetical protein